MKATWVSVKLYYNVDWRGQLRGDGVNRVRVCTGLSSRHHQLYHSTHTNFHGIQTYHMEVA